MLFELEQIVRCVMLMGFTSWLSIAVVNNVIDRQTNTTLLHRVFSQQLLKEDPELGNGLLHRALRNLQAASYVMLGVIFVQACIVATLWCGVGAYIYGLVTGALVEIEFGLLVSTLGLLGALCMWFFFLCGGLYFGYWIKMPHVQQVHFALVIITLQLLFFIQD